MLMIGCALLHVRDHEARVIARVLAIGFEHLGLDDDTPLGSMSMVTKRVWPLRRFPWRVITLSASAMPIM